jgi:hypothetical protein
VSQPIRVCRQLRVEVGAGAKASVIDIAGDPGILHSLMGDGARRPVVQHRHALAARSLGEGVGDDLTPEEICAAG